MKPDEQKRDALPETSVLFWVNYDGFPISSHVWNRMFDHCIKVQPSFEVAVRNIRNEENPNTVPIPKPPTVGGDVSVTERIEAVQDYIKELQYNHTGTQFFDIKKHRPLTGLMETAKEMIRESLPIKCLEAVVLGLYLTNGLPGLERFPVGFKTSFGNAVHQHIVLGLCWMGRYGALGLSRRADLMYKPLEYASLADLVIEFVKSYHQYWHEVKKVKVGYPVSHNPQSFETIVWKGTVINPSSMTRDDIRREMERHAKEAKLWVKHGPSVGMLALSPRRPQPALAPRRPAQPKPTDACNDRPARFVRRKAISNDPEPADHAHEQQQQQRSSKFEMRI